MAEPTHDRDARSVTDRTHETSWSASLEKPRHADDPANVVAAAVEAVHHSTDGTHVNLVTHADHRHPETNQYDALAAEFGDDVDWVYVEQCGCGGHVVRVHL